MTTEVKAPVLPESVADGIIAAWHVKVGDQVSRDQNLLDLETDKVVLEVPAPVDGELPGVFRMAEGGAVAVFAGDHGMGGGGQRGGLFLVAVPAIAGIPVLDRVGLPLGDIPGAMVAVHVAPVVATEVVGNVERPDQENQKHDADNHEQRSPNVTFQRRLLSVA